MPRRLITLFCRDFNRFSGGHLKVWDYFNHVRNSSRHTPRIYFSPRTVWDASNPWIRARRYAVPGWSVRGADILFLGGTDWKMLSAAERRRPPVPILNLIQHVRHGLKSDSRYKFLKHRAIRICVSHEVAEALRATQVVHGPVFVIPNGIDLERLPAPPPFARRPVRLLLAGLKQPRLANRIARAIGGQAGRTELLTEPLHRAAFLKKLGNAQVAVLLPNPSEGFYLPALEAMALGTVVVCPDCVGNRGFCTPGANCFRPVYQFNAIVSDARAAMQLPRDSRRRMVIEAKRTARSHSMRREQAAFHEILNNLNSIW